MATAAAGVTGNSDFLQSLKAEIATQLGGNFPVLGRYPDADRIILGIISVESGKGMGWGNVNVAHEMVPATSGFGKSYEAHQVVRAARTQTYTVNQTNLSHGRLAQSLMGCMGAYLIRGLQNGPGGFPHVQVGYSGVAESVGLLVNPGDSVTALFTPDAVGLRRGLVAGLCIFEHNYKLFLKKYNGNQTNAIQNAVRVHLGDPTSADVVTGISTSDYLARVMNNANSSASGPSAKNYMSTSSGGVKTASNSQRSPGVTPGCGGG